MPGPGSAPRQADAHEASRSPALDISPDEALSALQKILDSPTFRNAARHRRFLDFIVRKAVAGDGDQIKEYVVGLEVFDRPPAFDPRSDPMVRAEARRLRARLADYYSGEGRADPVVIDLPKGTYVPVFARVGREMPPSGPGASTKVRFWHSKVLVVVAATIAVSVIAVVLFIGLRARTRLTKVSDSIAVLPFVNLSDQPGRQYIGDGVAAAGLVGCASMRSWSALAMAIISGPKRMRLTPTVCSMRRQMSFARPHWRSASQPMRDTNSIPVAGRRPILRHTTCTCKRGIALTKVTIPR